MNINFLDFDRQQQGSKAPALNFQPADEREVSRIRVALHERGLRVELTDDDLFREADRRMGVK